MPLVRVASFHVVDTRFVDDTNARCVLPVNRNLPLAGITSLVRAIEVSGCDESPSETTPPFWQGFVPVQTCWPNAANELGNETSEPVPGSVLLSQFAWLLLCLVKIVTKLIEMNRFAHQSLLRAHTKVCGVRAATSVTTAQRMSGASMVVTSGRSEKWRQNHA